MKSVMTRSEAHLEPSQTSTVEFFRESSKQLSAVNYFRIKNSIVDVRLGSKYASDYGKFVFQLPGIFLFEKWRFTSHKTEQHGVVRERTRK